jgi:hypothetical protein
MPPAEQRPRDRKWRRYFRRCRIGLLLVALSLVGVLVYLNQVGLPEFLRRPLLERLRDRGLDLQLSTLRLHFYRGIVAEDVKAGRMGDAASPRFTAREADLKLSLPALARLQLVVSGVGLRDGRLTFPIPATNQPARALPVEKIRVDLRFLPDDAWSLEDFHAVFAGADFSLTGVITNATALRDLPFWRGEPAARDDLVGQRLRRFADTLEKIHFTVQPEMRGMLSGDARDLESFTLRLTVTAPDADTPWGRLTNGVLTAWLLPAVTVTRPHAELHLHATSAQTPWADIARLDLELRLQASAVDTNLVNASLILDAASAITRWASVTNARLTAHWLHTLTNAIPLSGHGQLQADAATSRWATARGIELTADLATPVEPPLGDESWAWWQSLQPYELGWSARAARLDLEKLGADDVACGGNWRAPSLQITNLHVRFPDGQLQARGRLDVPTRAADFELQSDFDVHRLSPLLTENANRWLAKYTWATPPHLAGSGAVILPAWTNRQPDWSAEVLPSLRLAAQLAITNGAYLGVPADWATSHLSYTNQVWRLPDLVAGRPEGQLQLTHIADDNTHEFFFGIHSTIDVRTLRPLLTTNQQNGFDYFTFAQPPVIEGEVWGRWHENDRLGFQGRVTLADFTFREQTATHFESALRYTNRVLEFLQPRLERGRQSAGADGITADFNAQRVYFTNALSTAEPLVIARAIGPKTGRALEPYRFTQPPVVHVNGYAPLQGDEDADLRFDVDGGPFEWLKFKIPHIAGQVHWLGDSLRLTNVQLTAYDGAAAGFANFDFRPAAGTDFQFTLGVTNADLRLLMADISTHTNNLEGRLSGQLVITNANSADKFSWDGRGQLQLKDGLIWSIPVFGVLSKPLDSLAPGLGSARIKEGAGVFSITNGVIFSDTLEMRSPTSRLLCHGTVDFAGSVNARVTAEPLRDPLGFSRILGLALWPVTKLFEGRVTGTLNAPKTDFVYLPKLLLHPFRTVEEILTGEAGRTAGPPVFKDVPPEADQP